MHILRNLRISEVSSVDKAANGDARIVLYKRDSEADDDNIDAKDIDSGNGDRDGNGGVEHVASHLADLLVEAADGDTTRQQALNWLLHNKHGRSLLSAAQHHKRASKETRKDFQMPTRKQVLTGYLKSAGGVDGLCRQIVKQGTTDVLEAELTGMITAAAKAAEPEMSDERAFSKLFTDPSPRGTMLRKAIEIAKWSSLLIYPLSTDTGDTDVSDDSGPAIVQVTRLENAQQRRISQDTDLEDTDENEGEFGSGPACDDAYAELTEKAATYRKAHPELSEQQAFSKIYQDPAQTKFWHCVSAARTGRAGERMVFGAVC
jgi:hypothetical protein